MFAGCGAVSSIVHCGSESPEATSLNTMRTLVPMPTRLTCAGRRQLAIRRAEVADDPQGLVGGRLALLRIQVDEQDQIRRVLTKRRLNCMMDLGVGMHRTLPFDLLPARFERRTPWAGGGRRVAQPAAPGAGLQMEIVIGAVPEIFEVLNVEIVESEPHAQIFGANSHACSPSQPRRMTIEEAVDGLAQPRLALTSTFLTWRHPPSR